jgi:hypothetical protein
MSGALATAAPVKSDAKSGPPMMANSFMKSTFQRIEEVSGPQLPTSFLVGAQQIGATEIPTAGFQRALKLNISNVVTGNTANVAYNADGPFSLFTDLSTLDINQNSLITNLTGYEIYLINKYGAFRRLGLDDPKARPGYSAVVGTGGTGGSFAYELDLPFEVNPRNGFCALANTNAAAPLRWRGSTVAPGGIYTTLPNGVGVSTIGAQSSTYVYPDPADMFGRPNTLVPPYNGATMYWTRQTISLNTGVQPVILNRTGRLTRSMILIARTPAGARDETLITRVQLIGESLPRYNLSRSRMRSDVHAAYNFSTQTAEAANGPDNGVFPLPYFASEFGGLFGWEMTENYLASLPSSRLELSVECAAATNLTILTQDIAVPVPL